MGRSKGDNSKPIEGYFVYFVCIVFYLVCIYGACATCDRKQAEECVIQMESALTSAVEETVGVSRSDRLQGLCLDVIKGNNLTECFIKATNSCAENDQVKTGDIIQRWERIMQDLYGLCDGACPSFLERTVNITQCTALIRFDALYDSSYQVFCGSLNDSLQCVSDTSEECPQFSRLFYDLLPEGMNKTASTICTGGCDNFDNAVRNLEACKTFVTDLPDDLDEACISYKKFKSCVEMSQAPVECPMFSSLMEVLYPQHIFGLYEQSCNQSHSRRLDKDKCGDTGVARIDHCVRVFALAWPSSPSEVQFSSQQCKDFNTGVRCLERAAFSDCPSLREHFLSLTRDRDEQRLLMKEKCPVIMQATSHASTWTSVFGLPVGLLTVLTNYNLGRKT